MASSHHNKVYRSAVLFDLDGTLHDRAQGILGFASNQYSRLGTDQTQCERYVSRFIELDANGMVWKDQVYQILSDEFELTDKPSVAALVDEYIRLYPKFAAEISGAHDALVNLKEHGLKLGIVTNGRTDLQHAVIETLGFDLVVDAVVVSEEAGFRKPQRQIFEAALELLGVDASNSVMVGDSLKSDVEGALVAGIQPIAFRLPSAPVGVTICHTMPEVVHAARLKINTPKV